MNPYAPPGDPAPPAKLSQPPLKPTEYIARRDGNVLIVSLGAPLPGVCLKCASHHELTRRHVRFQFTPVWARMAIVFCVLGGVVAMALTMKRTALDIPLCASCNKAWTAAKTSLIGGTVLLVLSVVALRFDEDPRALLGLCAVVLVGFIVVALAYAKPRLLGVRRIDDELIELTGVHDNAAQEIAEGSVAK